MQIRFMLCGICIVCGGCGADRGVDDTGAAAGTGGGTAQSSGGGDGTSAGGAAGAGQGGAAGGASTGSGTAGQGGGTACTPGEATPCYEGPSGTLGVASCAGGQHTCGADGQSFGPCEGQVLPTQEACDAVDNDCDGEVDEDLRKDCILDLCSPGFSFCGGGIWGDCHVPTVDIDPSPEATVPGKYGCDGCPDTSDMVFTQDLGSQTAATFAGVVTGAVGDGTFYLESALGERFLAPLPTDAATGAYSIVAPLFCGPQTMKLVWTNGAGQYTLVESLTTSNCLSTDLRATVTWDGLGHDWELHLIKPGGHINDGGSDCTWNTCVSSSPDWGVAGDATDNPKKDVDNVSTYGPENIWLNKPEAGIYTVMVEHWGNGLPESDGAAFVNIRGAVYEVKIENLAPQHVWTVGTIEMPCGVFTPSTDIYDCTAQWVGGCKALVP